MHSRSLCQHVAQDLYPAMECGTGQTSASITAEQVSVIIPDTSRKRLPADRKGSVLSMAASSASVR